MEQGGRRRKAAQSHQDLQQTLNLFRQLIHTINQHSAPLTQQDQSVPSSSFCHFKGLTPTSQQGSTKSDREVGQMGKEKKGLCPIKVRGGRDWEGLCSERKEDVLGQYQVCFSYKIVAEDETEEKPSGCSSIKEEEEG